MRLAVCGCEDESEIYRIEGGAELVVRIRVNAAYKVVLLVSHDPGSRLVSVIPCSLVSKVGGLHCSVSVVAGVGLGVAVVEAAAVVVVLPVDHPVLAFSLVVNCDALGVVPAESHSRSNECAVNLVAVNCDGSPVCNGDVVESSHGMAAESSAGSLVKVVSVRTLVVDDGNPAIGVFAEFVLSLGVGVSVRIYDFDVKSLSVRLTHYLVERSVIRLEKRTGGAVGRGAGSSSGGVHVAGALRP